MSCSIETDHRQRPGRVPDLLLEMGLPVVIKNNATPDYLWTPEPKSHQDLWHLGGYWIEQKTWSDFFDSCNGTETINGKKVMKVVRQLWVAKKSGAHVTLLLEGIPWVNKDGTVRDRRWKESAVDAVLLRLSRRGVEILLSPSPEKSAQTIATLYKIDHEVGTVWPTDALAYTPLPALPIAWVR